jgi:hypothetical protein
MENTLTHAEKVQYVHLALRLHHVELSKSAVGLIINAYEAVLRKGGDLTLREVIGLDSDKMPAPEEPAPLPREVQAHIDTMRQMTFHQDESEAQGIIDAYVEGLPELLQHHPLEWYRRNC